MYLPPEDPSSPVPSASSISMTPKPRMVIQRCENGFKMRKLNDDVEEDNDSSKMESNIRHVEAENKLPVVSEPEAAAALVPHATKPETTEEEAQKVCAREQLYKLCGVRHWKAPLYTFFNQDGPDNTKLFKVEVSVEIKEVSGITVLECLGDPHNKKKIAAEQAAEVALWFLKNMRRSAASSKKKSDSITSSTTDLFRSASSKATTKEMDRIDHLFNQYANTSSNLIDPEGIEELCSNLEVPHTDIRILMLAWKMKSEKQGYFTQEEWRRGLKALRADTLNKLKKALPELEKEVRRQTNFADFYAYAFRYCLTEEKQKSIDIETICQLLEIVMGSTFRPQVDYFVEYLKIQNDYKVINMDQWMGFYRFCNEISFPEMTEYNPELAWPLVLDNFVEWIREKQA
ncbi:BnaC05g12090D [Brassica napus]|uniref:Defective in cullin neddylation protein n=1 Tax=Brassica napus TaxID=3708 RepID=A0A078H7A0_BRANA|nr:unnamed protein product [Brassica napus]CDY33374.1 BnaC05g12090D [Brassica napus]